MKVFYSFMVLFAVTILFMLPITPGVYDFRTDVKDDTFWIEEDGATTTANVTLLKSVYDDDVSTISVTSDLFTDSPAVAGYHTATRVVDITGLTISQNRTLTVAYDYDALNASDAIANILDVLPWIWLLCVIAFAPCALVAMWVLKK